MLFGSVGAHVAIAACASRKICRSSGKNNESDSVAVNSFGPYGKKEDLESFPDKIPPGNCLLYFGKKEG